MDSLLGSKSLNLLLDSILSNLLNRHDLDATRLSYIDFLLNEVIIANGLRPLNSEQTSTIAQNLLKLYERSSILLFRTPKEFYDFQLKILLTIGSLDLSSSSALLNHELKFKELVRGLKADCQLFFKHSNKSVQEMALHSDSFHNCKMAYIQPLMNANRFLSLKKELINEELTTCLTNYTQTCLSLLRSLNRVDASDNLFDFELFGKLLELFQTNQASRIENLLEIRVESFNLILNRYLPIQIDNQASNLLKSLIITLNNEQSKLESKNVNLEFYVYCKNALLSKMNLNESFR